jgi:nucleoside phosphorylase
VIQTAGLDPRLETPSTGACQFMTMSSHASHAGVNVRSDRSLRVDVAIPAALDVEEAAIVEALGDCSVVRWKGVSLHLGTVAGQRVLVFPIGGMGNAGAAQATERVIGFWNPARVMLVGIAGGAPGSAADMRPGDILVPDQVVGYELAKVTPGDTARRYEVYRPDVELLTRARSLRPTDWADAIATPRPDDPDRRIRPLVHVGPVLTGDKVLADEATLARLRLAWPKAIGIEMESLGVALAAYQNGPGFLMVKAVSDFADGTKDDAWHRYAAEAAARFAVAVLAGASPPAGTGRTTTAALPGRVPKTYPGRVKVAVCQRLHADWEDVADIFDVPLHVKARFRHGQQPRDLWEWLEVRMRLHALPAALNEIGRPDLADVLQSAEP